MARESRTGHLLLKLTATERRAIDAAARAEGKASGAWVRQLALLAAGLAKTPPGDFTTIKAAEEDGD